MLDFTEIYLRSRSALFDLIIQGANLISGESRVTT